MDGDSKDYSFIRQLDKTQLSLLSSDTYYMRLNATLLQGNNYFASQFSCIVFESRKPRERETFTEDNRINLNELCCTVALQLDKRRLIQSNSSNPGLCRFWNRNCKLGK
jgi:hypothetical protein